MGVVEPCAKTGHLYCATLNEQFGLWVQAVGPVLGYEVYEIDLSSWKLSLSDRTTANLGETSRP